MKIKKTIGKKASKNRQNNFLAFFPSGKKAMMDDLFDVLITVFLAFFILLFIGLTINGTVEEKREITLNHLESTEHVNDFLVLERGILVEGGEIDTNNINIYIKRIRENGVPKKAGDFSDDPWVLGTDSSGDPIVIVG
jgi:hypothetical protein